MPQALILSSTSPGPTAGLATSSTRTSLAPWILTSCMGYLLRVWPGSVKEPLKNCAIGRIASLHPRSPLAYLSDMSRGFAAGRLALHPAITLFQRFLKVFDARAVRATANGTSVRVLAGPPIARCVA